MTDHEEREQYSGERAQLAAWLDGMGGSDDMKALASRAARLLREPVNAKAVYALGHFMHAEIGDGILILDSDDREERADGSVVYQLKACAAAERVTREMPAWVTRGTFDEMATEAKRLTARVQWLEAECARWKFDADTTREAHICTHRRAEKIEAENARLRAAPRVGVEDGGGRAGLYLLPCPFCGGEAELDSGDEVFCRRCDLWGFKPHEWNRRAPEPPAAAQGPTPDEDVMLRYISETAPLLSLLYDTNLLPEQTRGTPEYRRTLLIAAYWHGDHMNDASKGGPT